MKEPICCRRKLLVFVGAFFVVGLICEFCLVHGDAHAQFSSSAMKQRGNAERGRELFNGRGICFYCHGKDGDINQRPQLNPDTMAVIARLNPRPHDLRNSDVLKLKTDEGRFRLIREGHSGTGMLPDTTLTNEDIIDILAYLSALRGEVVLCIGSNDNDHGVRHVRLRGPYIEGQSCARRCAVRIG